MTVVQTFRKLRHAGAGLIATPLALTVLPAWAHPGHVEQPVAGWLANLAHLLSEPDHLALIALAVGVGLAARQLKRRGASRPSNPRRDR